MQILLYSGFRKRENSTKTPLVADATRTVNGYLREPCSIINPVFKIERFPSDASPQSFTYAYIGEFARWYFVRDWTWADGLWQCSLEVDVLGSFKTQIGNTYAYVERCSSEFDGSISDRFYLTTTNFQTQRISLSSTWYGVAPSGGCFVVGIICNANRGSSQVGGAVTYYVMTPSQMGNFMGYLLGGSFLDDAGFPQTMTTLQQLTRETAKALLNPMQYIASCMWFPFNASYISDGMNHPIVLGYYDLDSNTVEGQYLNATAFEMGASCEIPIHPQAADRGKYLNYAPYTRFSIQIPPFGTIPLDTTFCEIGSYLHCRMWCDPITGKCTMRVEIFGNAQHTEPGATVRECSSMLGVPIQLAQMTPDYLTLFSNAITLDKVVNDYLTMPHEEQNEGAYYSFGEKSYSGAVSALEALMPQLETLGVTGSFLETIIPPQLIAQFFIITDEDNAEFGRPLMKKRVICNLSGFIKCRDAETDFACLDAERQRIHNFMTGGFFWEESMSPGGMTIIVQPQNIQSPTGTSVTFSIVATGVESYQWEYQNNNNPEWLTISAASSRTPNYTTTVNSTRYNQRIRCRLTDSQGNILYSNVVYVYP